MWRARGFTLVELLVVLTLVGLLLALVSPLGFQQLERARAQSEWLEVRRLVGQIAFTAFLRGDFVTLQADGARLGWQWQAGEAGEREFEHLFFPPRQTVSINPNGIPDAPRLAVHVRGRPEVLVLPPWQE